MLAQFNDRCVVVVIIALGLIMFGCIAISGHRTNVDEGGKEYKQRHVWDAVLNLRTWTCVC